MAITFLQTKKRQKYMIIILALVICLIIFVVWNSFLSESTSPISIVSGIETAKININWEILDNTKVQGLKLFEMVEPFEEEIGRENPFIPY